jgi:hypothetical protein
MIGKGHPEAKENAKALRNSGAVLFFATDANMLYAREGDQWICLGHGVPIDAPRMNQPIPKITGNPYAGVGVRLMGVRD